MLTYKINQDLLQHVIDYLKTCTYEDVYQLIPALLSLEKVDDQEKE